jgi:hypothetical protein
MEEEEVILSQSVRLLLHVAQHTAPQRSQQQVQPCIPPRSCQKHYFLGDEIPKECILAKMHCNQTCEMCIDAR